MTARKRVDSDRIRMNKTNERKMYPVLPSSLYLSFIIFIHSYAISVYSLSFRHLYLIIIVIFVSICILSCRHLYLFLL